MDKFIRAWLRAEERICSANEADQIILEKAKLGALVYQANNNRPIMTTPAIALLRQEASRYGGLSCDL